MSTVDQYRSWSARAWRRGILIATLVMRTADLRGQAVWEGQSEAARQRVGLNGWLATIPFELDGDPLIIVAARVNGSAPVWWVLDSGASLCLIDRKFATTRGLRSRGRRQIKGAGRGKVSIDTVIAPVRLTLHGFATGCDTYAAADLGGLTTSIGRPIAGILGYEFLARQVVTVDFAAHTIRLFDRSVYRHVSPGDTLSIDLSKRQPRVTIRIRDGDRLPVERTLLVDTGSGDAIDDSSLVNHSSTLPRYTVTSSGLGESYRLVVGTLDSAWVGQALLTRVPSAAGDVGIIGNAVWSRFTCTFDYAHGRLFLEANENFDLAFDRGPRSGILFFASSSRGEPVVSEVNPGSPGEALGVRPGDIIYEIDGRPIRTIGLERLIRLLNRPGSVYRLGWRRGAELRRATLVL